MRQYYPCEIKFEDGTYYVNFIDFEEAFTDGETLEEALLEAKDMLEGLVFSYLKNGKEIPKPTLDFNSLEINARIVYVDIWLEPILDKVNNSSVKKTLTIPKWLNDEAEKHAINFSSLL